MKKISYITTLFLLANSLNADMLNLELGGGVWNAKPKGDVKYKNTTNDLEDNFGLKREILTYAYADIKHPLFIFPNLRFEYNDLSVDGSSSKTFNYGNKTFSGLTNTNIDLKSFDVITYFNLLDSFEWSIDLGGSLKYLNGNVDVKSANAYENSDLEIVIPYLYGNIRYQFMDDYGVELSGKYFRFDSATSYDSVAKVDYKFYDNFFVEGGYKKLKIDVDDDFVDKYNIDTALNIDYSGLFIGAGYRF